ncbi:UNVERIFIED_CONTAM: hypothetical protein NCL1_51025 [Trichonephila clavipes]
MQVEVREIADEFQLDNFNQTLDDFNTERLLFHHIPWNIASYFIRFLGKTATGSMGRHYNNIERRTTLTFRMLNIKVYSGLHVTLTIQIT